MAKTKKGEKVVWVKTHWRKVKGKRVKIKAHKRSTPD